MIARFQAKISHGALYNAGEKNKKGASAPFFKPSNNCYLVNVTVFDTV